MGQPGVYEAKLSAWNPFTDDRVSNIGKGLVSNVANNVAEKGIRAYAHTAVEIVQEPIFEFATSSVATGEVIERMIYRRTLVGILQADDIIQYTAVSVGKTSLVRGNAETVSTLARIGYHSVEVESLPLGRIAGKFVGGELGLVGLDAGIGFGIDVGYQLLLDARNPYLNTTQKWQRAVLGQGTGSGVSFIVATSIGGPIGLIVGIGVSIAWDKWAAPIIYERLDAIPTRHLAPLNQ